MKKQFNQMSGQLIDLHFKNVERHDKEGVMQWKAVLHDKETRRATAYVVSDKGDQPRGDGVRYLCEVGEVLYPVDKKGFSIVEVSLVGEIPAYGREMEVTFKYVPRRDGNGHQWAAEFCDKGVTVVILPEESQVAILGTKTPGRAPRFVVVPKRTLHTSPDSRFRLMVVGLVREVISDRARRRRGETVAVYEPSKKNAQPVAAVPAAEKTVEVGKANCGCAHHAEEGIACEHDVALSAKK